MTLGERLAIAEMEGNYAAAQRVGGWMDAIPGLNILKFNQDNEMRRAIELRKDNLEAIDAGRVIARFGSIGKTRLATHEEMVEIPHARGFHDVHPKRRQTVTDNDGLKIQAAIERAYAGFGSTVSTGFANDSSIQMMRDMGMSTEEIVASYGPTAQYSSMVGGGDIRKLLREQKVAAAQRLTASRAAGNLDRNALNSMVLSGADRKRYTDEMLDLENLRDEASVSSLGLSRSRTGLGTSRLMGLGYKQTSRHFEAMAASLDKLEKLKRGQAEIPGISDFQRDQFLSEAEQIAQQALENKRAQWASEFDERGGLIGADVAKARTAYSRILMGGGDANALSAAIDVQSANQMRGVALKREQLRRRTDLSPVQRAELEASIGQEEFDATIGASRQKATTRYSLATAGAGLLSSEAGYMSLGARLFGGPQATAAAAAKEGTAIDARLAAISEILKSSYLSQEEQTKYLIEQRNLQARQVENTETMVRAQVRQEYSISAAGVSLLSTDRGTAYSKGVGGVQGLGLSIGVLNQSKEAARRAAKVVDTLVSRGVSADNPEMIAAKQTQAQAEAQVAAGELGLSESPTSIGLRRESAQAHYSADILSALPGSYGNIKAAYRKQIDVNERTMKEVQSEYAQVAEYYGGMDKVPDAVKERYESRLFGLGRESVSALQQLSYGWESRLTSEILGQNGNMSFISNRFNLADAVGKGIHNAHFGSSKEDLPMFLQIASGDYTALSGVSGGLLRSALTSDRGSNPLAKMVGIPEYALPTRTASQPGVAGGAPAGDGKIHIQIDITQDGKIIRTEQRRITPSYNPYNEDVANFRSLFMRGQ